MTLRLRIVCLLLLGSACHKTPAKLDAGPASADAKAELAAMSKSFRAFVEVAYPGLHAPLATRTCHLQTSVARRTGPPDTWSGMLSGEIVKNGHDVRLRVKFLHPDEKTWTCSEDGSRIVAGLDGDAGGPASICAYLAGECGPP